MQHQIKQEETTRQDRVAKMYINAANRARFMVARGSAYAARCLQIAIVLERRVISIQKEGLSCEFGD